MQLHIAVKLNESEWGRLQTNERFPFFSIFNLFSISSLSTSCCSFATHNSSVWTLKVLLKLLYVVRCCLIGFILSSLSPFAFLLPHLSQQLDLTLFASDSMLICQLKQLNIEYINYMEKQWADEWKSRTWYLRVFEFDREKLAKWTNNYVD